MGHVMFAIAHGAFPMVQSCPFSFGSSVGGLVQERDRGGRRGGLHRSQSSESGHGEGPGGLSVEQLWETVGGRVKGNVLSRSGPMGNGKKAREGLVRAYFCDQGVGFDAEKWQEVSRLYRRLMGLALGKKPGLAEVSPSAKGLGQTAKNTAELLESEDNETALKDLGTAKMLRCRIRYFTDGAVIGSKEFVNEAFASARDRFGPKRKDGARKLKGDGAAAAGTLWSLRDLRKGIACPE
jgi:hypothetical protein